MIFADYWKSNDFYEFDVSDNAGIIARMAREGHANYVSIAMGTGGIAIHLIYFYPILLMIHKYYYDGEAPIFSQNIY